MKKLVLVITAVAFSTSLFAKGWEDFKAHRLEQLNKRISILQESKLCIEAASSKEAFQACNKAGKEKHKSMKESNAQFKEERKAQREAKKKEKEDKKK